MVNHILGGTFICVPEIFGERDLWTNMTPALIIIINVEIILFYSFICTVLLMGMA